MNEKRYTILLVEDERPLQKAIMIKLQNNGLDVITATDVDQALKYLEDPDVDMDAVWLDHYLLGTKSGLDFLSKAKEEKYIDKIPVFVVTNTGGYEKKQSYLSLGASKYYVKSDHSLDEIVKDIQDMLLEIHS